MDNPGEYRKRPAPAAISRRTLLTVAAAAIGSALLDNTPKITTQEPPKGGLPPTPSPYTNPWRHPLPTPPVKEPLADRRSLRGGPVVSAEHQYYSLFAPRKFYEMTLRPAQHTFHQDLGPSLIWGYDGIFPGPTFDARYGEPILVRIHNDLPTNQHGDPNEALGTLFYHAHRPDFTAPNVYKGQVGFFRAFDDVDTGDETSGLCLPSGEFDVPLLFADKAFDAEGQLFFDPFNIDGILGDKSTVNGVIQPFFNVQRRKYRFRFLVGGPSRFMRFYLMRNGSFLSNGPFIQISNDGNLLAEPIRRNNFVQAPAERFDIVIDFKELIGTAGGELTLYNRAEQRDGRQPTGRLLSPGDAILKFIVEPGAPEDRSQVPATLRPQVPVDLSEVVTTRTFRFGRSNGAWTINDKFFDPRKSRAQIQRGTSEIWVLKNNDDGWQHPIHIHFEEFHILSRNGVAPPAWERGRKDVLLLGPLEEVRLFFRFRDFPEPGYMHWDPARQANVGRYPMHCHNLTHEDHAMMLRWDIVG